MSGSKSFTGRRLSAIEEVFASRGQYPRHMVWCEGNLDLTALSAAYEALTQSHPVLRGSFQPTEDGGWELVPSENGSREIHVREGDPDDIETGFTDLDQTADLAGVDVVVQGDRARVSFQVHHALADGNYQLSAFFELWTHYTNIVRGTHKAPEPHPIPKSMEQLFDERGIERIKPTSFAQYAEYSEKLKPAEDTAQLAFSARELLTKEDTDALVKLSREEKLPLHSLVSAAILLARARFVDEPVAYLPYQFSVDLRAHVDPPISTFESGIVLSVIGLVLEVRSDTDPLSLAQEVNKTLVEELASGNAQKSALNLAEQLRKGGKPHAFANTSSVTNVGRLPEFPTPDGLKVTDIRARFAKWPSAHPDPAVKVPLDFYLISTLGGRLSVDLAVSTLGSGEQLIEAVHEQLALLVSRAK